MNYAEFSLSPEGIFQTVRSYWECRDIGLLKIMTRIFEMFLDCRGLNDDITVRINTHDYTTRDYPTPGASNFMEFDTSSAESMENLFPDYVFGNWWHIGLDNFFNFANEIENNNDVSKIEDNRIFWIGCLQCVPQRNKYIEMAKEHPTKLVGETMGWSFDGRNPDKFVPIKDFCRYKYLIDLTGTGCSGRLKLLPFCNRPLFVAKRQMLAWSDFLMLEQNLHIPVAEDLSDLLDKYDWAESNGNLVFDNSMRLLEFCRDNLSFERACQRGFELINSRLNK